MTSWAGPMIQPRPGSPAGPAVGLLHKLTRARAPGDRTDFWGGGLAGLAVWGGRLNYGAERCLGRRWRPGADGAGLRGGRRGSACAGAATDSRDR